MSERVAPPLNLDNGQSPFSPGRPVPLDLFVGRQEQILAKMSRMGLGLTFRRADVLETLSDAEKARFDRFLQRMKKLGALRSGEARGQYAFANHLIRVYLTLQSQRQ